MTFLMHRVRVNRLQVVQEFVTTPTSMKHIIVIMLKWLKIAGQFISLNAKYEYAKMH